MEYYRSGETYLIVDPRRSLALLVPPSGPRREVVPLAAMASHAAGGWAPVPEDAIPPNVPPEAERLAASEPDADSDPITR